MVSGFLYGNKWFYNDEVVKKICLMVYNYSECKSGEVAVCAL